MKKVLGLLITMFLGACMAFAQQPANPNQQPQNQLNQQQQNQQMQQGEQGQAAGQQRLPQTASPLPLIAILGFGAIGTGVAVRNRRREALEQ
jgi:hypothetical protein